MMKRMMIEEGDMGIEIVNVNVNENDDVWGGLVEEGYIEYLNKEECVEKFKEMCEVDECDDYISDLLEKSEGVEGRWFVGSDGEYVVMVGVEF